MTKLWFKIPAVLYAAVIFLLSSIPQQNIMQVEIWNFDKVEHLFEYSIFGVFLMLAFVNFRSEKVTRNAVLISLIIGILYAGTDEIHQLYIPGRFCSVYDLIADTIGVALGAYYFTKSKWIARINSRLENSR
ncbi:MAG: VanZ family protein [Candidatus Marinimicrobia bacterium]|nr:VanZ family protein [Candidatus Neomarinimicrobiota bacterium]